MRNRRRSKDAMWWQDLLTLLAICALMACVFYPLFQTMKPGGNNEKNLANCLLDSNRLTFCLQQYSVLGR